MKYIKLFLLFFLLVSFTSVSAVDLLEPDNEANVPEIEPLKIDLEAIKKKSKIQKSAPHTDKKKRTARAGKNKTGKSAAVKKKKASVKKKPASGAGKPAVKTVNTVEKTSDKTSVKKHQAGETKIKSDDKNFNKTEKSEKIDKQPLNTESMSDANKLEADKKIVPIEKKAIVASFTDIIIINPLDKELSDNRLYKIRYEDILKWVKQQGLKVKEDAPPVVDGIAFYTPDYFAEFKVEGYDRSKDYKLFIDFVRFSGETKNINSLLKIWGRDYSGKMYLIAEINRQILKEDKIFKTLIPYQLSSPGRFDIIVREYSDTPGKWGIWDMVITDKEIDHVELIKPDVSEKMKVIEPKIFK